MIKFMKLSPEVSESIPSFLYLSASINKVDFMFLVDTGAAHSCIPLNLVEIKNLPINDKKIQQLKLANGDYFESPGTVDAHLVLKIGPPTLSATDKNEFLLDSVITHAYFDDNLMFNVKWSDSCSSWEPPEQLINNE
ncbi:hypothetical protein RCL1_008677 [Eukaryota sp. TZLM3-RCL]